MAPLIRIPVDMFKEVEKLLLYRFWDGDRRLSNHGQGIAEYGAATWRCLRQHERLQWVGPPHDPIRAYVCLDCHGAACEPEIRDRGFEFDLIPDWEIHKILDLDLERQRVGKRTAISYR
mgnify:CR=1 FL=1